jgi:diaminopimelate epimerase
VETLAGIKYLDLQAENGKVALVTVNMGAPELVPAKIPVKSEKEILIKEPIEVKGKTYEMTCVSMGNPHCVVFVEDTAAFPLEEVGPEFEKHPVFPNRVNAEFIQILDRKTVNMRVWERGTGETLACGTGACASTVACILNGLTEEEITLHLLGGDLKVRWDREENLVYMTGPATVVFDGEYKAYI